MNGGTLVGVLLCVICVMVTFANASGCPAIRNESGPFVPDITDDSTVDDVMMYGRDQPLTLSCCVRGQPKPNITWLKGNGSLLLSERHQLMNDNQELKFARLLPEDSGEYTCIAKNRHGTSNYTIYMDIRLDPGKVLPPRVDMNKSWSVFTGDNITLACHVSSKVFAMAWWSKVVNATLDTYVPSNPPKIDNSLGKYTYTLTITNASLEDAGVYRCQAKNGVGYIPGKMGRLTVLEREVPEKTSPEITPPAKSYKLYIAAVGGGLALLVVALFVMALLYVKRRKPEGWVTRKLVQMGVIKKPQCHAETHGEDGDDECSCSVTWDVFVSYNDKDREWAMDVLHNKLSNAYSVCIDCQDNIARCIWRSKTTLFVVSREFLRSGWNNVEFEITQDKIRRAQGSLVVIMLDGIKWQELPPILRRYTTGKIHVDCKDKQLQPTAWRRLSSLLGSSIDPEENADATSEEKYRLATLASSA